MVLNPYHLSPLIVFQILQIFFKYVFLIGVQDGGKTKIKELTGLP